ncbi:MAG: dynamin family protein [Sandaracinaceae bacterium]|nr:dynamin family protein [Sandaracinaceae bacterium]
MSLLDRAARFIDDVLLLPDDVRERVEDAERALREGRHAEAEGALREVLAERPSLLRARQGLTLVLRAKGDLDGARAIAAVSRQLDPDEPEIALLSAQLALEAGDIAAAVEEARDAARRAAKEGGPRFAAACVVRARAERARNRPDRAARELRKALAADPEDHELRVELAETLAVAGRGASAAAALHGLDLEEVAPEVAERLGVALASVGETTRAKGLLQRAAQSGRALASARLAELALADGDLDAAETHARTAVARGGGALALGTLAEVLLQEGRPAEATQALLTASAALGGDRELLRRAARLCPLDAASELAHIADRLDAVSPGDGAARAARAWAALARGVDAARPLLLMEGDEPRLELARAAVAVRDGAPQLALDILARADRVAAADAAAVRALRRDALHALWRGDTGDIDLAAAIDEVARFAEQRALADVERRAHALRDELDRPLVLAILGEFNAGKSTLVNAFVGADVAPTGILPTTATLNLLRSGAEKLVRLVRRDGTTREGLWTQLKSMLEDAEEGGLVDHVEIVLPSELLERVWILDTPGSNAPVPEHEALAAEALRRADAALWIFDSGQAGKATEGKILSAIRASRRHVVGALNKVDRLKPDQLEQVQASLARELPELGAAPVVALSAKRALKARLAEDDAGWVDSGFPALLERLEQDVFSRSRQLKRRACGGRLLALLDDALGTEADAERATAERVAALEALQEPLSRASSKLADAVDEAISAYEIEQGASFEAAAKEVLSFVRPRSNRFARHGADLEDRAFLADVIEQQLAGASAACEARLCHSAGEVLRETAAGLSVDGESLDRRIRVAIGPAMARFAGFQDGVFAGGALRRFFEDELPHAELAVEPLAEALAGHRAHPRERLRPALRDAVMGLADAFEQERTIALSDVQRDAERLRDRVYEPLRALRAVLEELAD